MSKSAFSVFVYGIYVVLLGIIFLFFPNVCLSILGMKTTGEVWIHVGAWFVIWVGIYYIVAARSEAKAFIRWTTYGRPTFIVFLTVLVALHMIEPIMIIIGAIDVISAIWTVSALRSEKASIAIGR
jgi:hypothetical protein